jgi:hypothetical protein
VLGTAKKVGQLSSASREKAKQKGKDATKAFKIVQRLIAAGVMNSADIADGVALDHFLGRFLAIGKAEAEMVVREETHDAKVREDDRRFEEQHADWEKREARHSSTWNFFGDMMKRREEKADKMDIAMDGRLKSDKEGLQRKKDELDRKRDELMVQERSLLDLQSEVWRDVSTCRGMCNKRKMAMYDQESKIFEQEMKLEATKQSLQSRLELERRVFELEGQLKEKEPPKKKRKTPTKISL